jgi:dienelactone hydrolase
MEIIMKKIVSAMLLSLAMVIPCTHAEVVTETILYDHEGTTLEGAWVYDNTVTEPRAAVIVFHQWGGAGDYEKARAKMLAEQGYVAFVADVYGQGVRPETMEERRALATAYYQDRPMVRARARAALNTVQGSERVASDRIAAIGYCFGGMTTLELARDGAPVVAAVSIHGSLNTPTPSDATNITAHVLAQHGGDDPYVPAEELAGFRKEMEDAKVKATVTVYEGAVHSFTDWNAGSDPTKGAAYNEEVDKASWQELLTFLGTHLN